MTPHLSEEQVALYRDRALAAAELLLASRHIAECEACRARIASAANLYTQAEAFRNIMAAEANPPGHPAYDELAAYVDQQLDGEELEEIRLHLRGCEACAASVAEFEAVRREIGTAHALQSWIVRIGEFWRERVGWRGAFMLAGAAACATLAFFVFRAPADRRMAAPAQPERAGAQPPAGIHDGKRLIAVGADGTVAGLDGLPDSVRTVVAAAIRAQHIEVPAVLADLAGRTGVLLGESTQASGVDLLGPLGTVVETQRPLFRWKPAAGGEYRVTVYRDTYEEVAASAWTRGGEWQVPKRLERGGLYIWQLRVRRDGTEFVVPAPPQPEARFRVLGDADEAEMAQLKASAGDSHLVLGVRYAQDGVLDQAEEELRRAREQNPSSSAVSALLASVEHMRRHGH